MIKDKEVHFAFASPAFPLTLCGASTFAVSNFVEHVTCKRCREKIKNEDYSPKYPL